ncbi:hypothetical protein QJQ45_007664 [Haematococcus lacustris]|nr:hypothetical protein QJQ45_007664 [Haematococcus lacustris]
MAAPHAMLRNVRTHRRVTAQAQHQAAAPGAAVSALGKLARRQAADAVRAHRELLKAPSNSVACQPSAHETASSLLSELKRLEVSGTCWARSSAPRPQPPRPALPEPHQHSAANQGVALTATFVTTAGQAMQVPIPVCDPNDLDLELPEYAPRSYEQEGRVLVCQGSKCRAKGAVGVLRAVSAITSGSEAVDVLPCKCLGKCREGAVLRVEHSASAKRTVYTKVSPSSLGELLDSHFATQSVVQPSPALLNECL